MAMEPPRFKMGVDPVRSRDIMDDIVNVAVPRAFAPVASRYLPPRPISAAFKINVPPGEPGRPRPHLVRRWRRTRGWIRRVRGVSRTELPDDPELTAALAAGLDAVYKATQANIERNFGRFAEHCATDVFAVPDELTQANDLAENLPGCSVERRRRWTTSSAAASQADAPRR